ncbi:MAG: DUF1573 domain-containing protein [Verrucomicrobiae bacterium]|nr:DUF1573 domain-containing protein [Verrucomicrobiae bacterium]
MNKIEQQNMKSRSLLAVARLFLGVATIVAIYLGAMASGLLPALSPAPAEFLSTRWAHVFNVPVGYLGAALYGTLFLLSGTALSRPCKALALAQILALVTAMVAIYFTVVQHFFTGGLCGGCGIVHGLAVGGSAILLAATLTPGGRTIDYSPSPESICAALGIVTALSIVQSLQSDKPLAVTVELNPDKVLPDVTRVDFGTAKLVSLYGRFTINPEHYPVIGSTDADNFIVAVMDYLSEDCRAAHRQLVDLQRAYGKQLAVIELPGTSSPESGLIHRSMLELREASKQEFVALSELIYNTENVGELTNARIIQEIQKRIPASSIRAALESSGNDIAQRLAVAREVQNAASNDSAAPKLPHIIVRSQVVTGVSDIQEYAQMIQRNLNLAIPDLTNRNATDLKPPTVKLETPEIKIGQVSPGMEIPISIPVSNGGQSPLEVRWVQFGKDCQLVAVPKTPIHEGQSADIQVLVKVPSDKQGPFQRTFTIHSNATPEGNKVRVSGSI